MTLSASSNPSRRGIELELLHLNSGVFPKRQDVLVRWAEVYLDALSAVDLLAVWHNAGEKEIVAKYAPRATLTGIEALEPYYHDQPWTRGADRQTRDRCHAVRGYDLASARALFREGSVPGSPFSVRPDFELTTVRAPVLGRTRRGS